MVLSILERSELGGLGVCAHERIHPSIAKEKRIVQVYNRFLFFFMGASPQTPVARCARGKDVLISLDLF